MFMGYKGKVYDLTQAISEVAVEEFIERSHQSGGKTVDEQHVNIKNKKRQDSFLENNFDQQGDRDR